MRCLLGTGSYRETKTMGSEREAWRTYAAAALTGLLANEEAGSMSLGSEQIHESFRLNVTIKAAQLADEMMKREDEALVAKYQE